MFLEEGRSADKARKKLAADAMQLFHKAQADRSRQERQWYLNLAFYFGHQHVKERTAGSAVAGVTELYVPDAPYWRVRPTINQVRKLVRKEIARLTAQQPNAYVVPSSTEDRDVFAAQAGELIWDSVWREHNFNRILREAVFWQTTCGNGFLKQYWDYTKKDKLNDTWGDVAIEAITPFHIFVPDHKIIDLEDQPYVFHAQMRDKSWVRKNLNVEITDKKMQVIDERLLSIMGINQQSQRETAVILEVWAKPGVFDGLPQGGMFHIAMEQIVQGFEQWPYEHAEYPFSKLDGIPSGKFYNDSVIVDLIPLQRELNRTRGQIIEAKNRMAKPQLAAEKGSVNPSRITSEPGLVIEYKLGMSPPTPLPMQNLPSYVTEELNRTYADMADISGQHEVSEGKTPPGVTAAVAISYLQEQDESLISNHFDSIEEAIQKTAKHTLSYVAEYWDEERTIKVVGLDGSFDVKAFKGSELRGNTDIRVEAGSALPTSRAAKQAFITDLMQMGFIDPQEGLEVLEIGGLNKIYERVQADQRQAQRENLRMAVVKEEDVQKHEEFWRQQTPPELQIDPESGAQLDPPPVIPVNEWDNHPVHIEMHNRYRKSQAFEMAPSVVKQQFHLHVKHHREAILVGQAAQMPAPMTDPLGENANQPQPEEPPQDQPLQNQNPNPQQQQVPAPAGPGLE